MSKKHKERKAKATAARRHPKNETAEVIPLSDQAANDATINTQDANDGVVLQGDTEAPQISYDTTGRGDDLLPDDPPKKEPTNEEMAQAMADQIARQGDAEDVDIAFAELSLKFRDWLVGIPVAIGKGIKAVHDAVIAGWIKWDAFADRKVTALYVWADTQKNKFQEAFPPAVNVRHMHNFTQILAEVLAETEKKHTKHIDNLTARISMLEHAIDKKHPRTVPPEQLNDLFKLVKNKQNVQAISAYRALTGASLSTARDFINSFQG